MRRIQIIVEESTATEILNTIWTITAALSLLARPILSVIQLAPKFSLVFSNIPLRIPEGFTVFNGHKVSNVFELPPLGVGASTTLCARINAGSVTFTLVVDDDCVVEGCPMFMGQCFYFWVLPRGTGLLDSHGEYQLIELIRDLYHLIYI